jgi:hypothetical protein
MDYEPGRRGEGSEREGMDVDAGEPRPGRSPDGGVDEINDDEIDFIGDLGNEFDDPEGWMLERPDYWTDRLNVAHPTRTSLLRHRIAELFEGLRSLGCQYAPPWPPEGDDKTLFLRSAEELFGNAAVFPGDATETEIDQQGGR